MMQRRKDLRWVRVLAGACAPALSLSVGALVGSWTWSVTMGVGTGALLTCALLLARGRSYPVAGCGSAVVAGAMLLVVDSALRVCFAVLTGDYDMTRRVDEVFYLGAACWCICILFGVIAESVLGDTDPRPQVDTKA